MKSPSYPESHQFFGNQIKLKKNFQNSIQYLNILQNIFGSYSYHTLEAIKLLTSNFSQFATKLIQNINILKYSQHNQQLTTLVQYLIIFFIKQKGLTAHDLISLINDALSYQIENSKVVKYYGLREQNMEVLNDLTIKIVKLNDSLQLQSRQQKWEQAKVFITTVSSKLLPQFKSNYNQIKIESSEVLLEYWRKWNIPCRQTELQFSQIYQTIYCLGVDHSRSKHIIESFTYPGYIQRAKILLKCIVPASIEKKIDRQLILLFNYLKQQKYTDNYYVEKFQEIVTDYYEHYGELKILSSSRIASIDSKICEILKGLISPEKQPFKMEIVETIKKSASTIKSQYSQIEPSMYINQIEPFTNREKQLSQISIDPIKKLKDSCVIQVPAMQSIEIIRFPNQTTNKQSFTCEGMWQRQQLRMPQSSIATSYKGFAQSLSMQQSIGQILKFMNKSKNFSKLCQVESQDIKKPALITLVQQQSEIQLTKKSSKNSLRQSEKFISIGDKHTHINQKQKPINPFTLSQQKQINRITNIRVILIFISREQIGKMDIRRTFLVNGKQKSSSIDSVFTHRKYKHFHIMFSSFQAPDIKSKYQMIMHHNLLSKIRKQEYKIQILMDQKKIYHGYYFMLSIQQILYAIRAEMMNEAVHFSLFTCIKFVTKSLIIDHQLPGETIYICLKFLYDYYNDTSFELLKQIVKQLYISKSVPIIQSKYTIYFFYSLFLQNSLGYYFNTDLYKKVKFEKNYVFTLPPKIYSNLIILEQFYDVTQNINILIYYPKETGFIINSLCLSIKNQRPQNAYLILNIISHFTTLPVLQALQNQIIREFYNNSFLTAVQYFNVRINNIISSLQLSEQNYVRNVRNINTFIEDAILLCKQKKINKKRKVEYPCRCEIQKFIMTIPHKSAPVNWIIFISKLKELYKVSDGYINLIQSVETSYSFFLNRNLLVDYLKVLFYWPMLHFEKTQAIKIVKKISFDQSRMKSLIFELLKEKKQKYDLHFFKEFMIYFLKSRQLKQQQVEIIVINLDKISTQIEDKQTQMLITFIFNSYAFDSIISYNSVNQEVLRANKLDSYKSYLKIVKNQQYRIILIERILKILRQNSQNVDIKQLVWEIYPQDTPQDIAQRKVLLNIYQKTLIIKSQILNVVSQPSRTLSQMPRLQKKNTN